MNLDGEHSTFNVVRDLVLVLACIAALVLPFAMMRGFLGAGDATGAGQTDHPTTGARASATAASALVAKTSAAPSTTTAVSSTTSAGVQPLTSLAETCRLVNLRQQAPLSAADVSLAQFDKHIDAMNLLVAGKISLAVATTFWDQTRVGATQNVAAFHQADQEFRTGGARCAAPAPAVAADAPYGQVVAITACSSAIGQRNAALDRARAAVTTWEHHVHDMEMLRMGHITPAQATAAWKKNWHTGEKQLQAYEQAASKARKAHCSLD